MSWFHPEFVCFLAKLILGFKGERKRLTKTSNYRCNFFKSRAPNSPLGNFRVDKCFFFFDVFSWCFGACNCKIWQIVLQHKDCSLFYVEFRCNEFAQNLHHYTLLVLFWWWHDWLQMAGHQATDLVHTRAAVHGSPKCIRHFLFFTINVVGRFNWNRFRLHFYFFN